MRRSDRAVAVMPPIMGNHCGVVAPDTKDRIARRPGEVGPRRKEMIRIIAALIIAGIWCAPLAQADAGENVYLGLIHQNYFSDEHTDLQWLAEAHKVCNAHLSGISDDQLMAMVQADLNVLDNISRTVAGYAEGALGC
jgi:hypothetical protein